MFAPILLLLVVVAYRVILALAGNPTLVGLNNFSPMAAMVLCSAIFLPKKWALLLPAIALLVTDIILNLHYHAALFGWAMLGQYAAFGLIAAIGWSLRGNPRLWQVFGASIGGSILFYLVTNSAAWLYQPEYGASFSGWIQALTVGVPGWPPTWIFLRNTIVSDLAFTALFLVCARFQAPPPLPASRTATA